MKKIPFLDLDRQYISIKKELNDKIKEVINSKEFIQGKFVTEFEKSFINIHKAKHVISCSNGTSAIYILLQALGIGRGDEIITSPNTFIATIEGICRLGAKPVFVDIDPKTYNIDPNKIENAISKRTKAILPIHVYGQPAEMDLIKNIAMRNKLLLVEDCAQAHLAEYYDLFVGNFGDGGTFSFYPGKNLGAYGDAGAIITANEEVANKCRMLIDHGRKSKYIHEILGGNDRMDGIQGAILSVKLKYIREWTEKRIKIAKIYNKLLFNGTSLILPTVSKKTKHVFHLYVVQVRNREKVINYLKDRGISTSVHYPIPLHLQPALKFLGYRAGDLPVSETLSQKVLSIPIFSELTFDEIGYISKHLNFITK